MTKTQKQLVTEIEAAKKALNAAEDELQKIVGNIVSAPRAQKIEVSAVVRGAFKKLDAARATLSDVERSMAAAEIEVAKAAIADAESDLEKAINELVVGDREDKTWVTGVVDDAFARLRAAKKKLVELSETFMDEKD